jgi:hypothetical protein
MRIYWTDTPMRQGWKDVKPDAIVWLDVASVEASFSIDRGHYVGITHYGITVTGAYFPVPTTHLAAPGFRPLFRGVTERPSRRAMASTKSAVPSGRPMVSAPRRAA